MTSYKDVSIQESDGDTAFDALMNNEKQINLQYENKPKMAEKFKVKSVTFKNEFDTQNGKFFNFTVESEAGITGTYVSKSNPQTKFKVGEEIEVEIISDEKWGNKIKVAQTNTSNFGGGYTKKPFDVEADKFKQALIVAQSSMTKAVEMVIAGTVTADKLQVTCDKLMQITFDLAKKYQSEVNKTEL